MTTPEPILLRRRPHLKSPERRRRWLKDDEEEIPIGETATDSLTNTLTTDNPSTVTSDDTSSFNSSVQTDELTTIATNDEISENNNTSTEQTIENIVLTTITTSGLSTTKEMDVNQQTSSETISKFENFNSIDFLSLYHKR
jgi:hypothetical protein